MYKIDLHTHSIASPDGGLSLANYAASSLNYIAITDHDHIDFALQAQKKLGDKIIVGEEITTQEGEIIGLFLSKLVPSGLSAEETVKLIREQNGLVYIPHPFETVRKGLPRPVLGNIADEVDIVEVFNGRAIFQNKSDQARVWADQHSLPGAASSDAHGPIGWGKSFSAVSAQPTAQSLPELLKQAKLSRHYVGTRGILYPKYNRLRRKFKK